MRRQTADSLNVKVYPGVQWIKPPNVDVTEVEHFPCTAVSRGIAQGAAVRIAFATRDFSNLALAGYRSCGLGFESEEIVNILAR
jgi:hypothetical protein